MTEIYLRRTDKHALDSQDYEALAQLNKIAEVESIDPRALRIKTTFAGLKQGIQCLLKQQGMETFPAPRPLHS
jgi:hypothetical protein